MSNLFSELHKEINRVKYDLIPLYESIPTGIFAASLMKSSIKNAETAIENSDTVQMVYSLKELREFTG